MIAVKTSTTAMAITIDFFMAVERMTKLKPQANTNTLQRHKSAMKNLSLNQSPND